MIVGDDSKTMTATRTLIKEIYERERVAAARVGWPSDVQDRKDRAAQRRVLRSLFRAEVDTVRTFARWGTCPDDVPAARMVLRQQPLLVNVSPMTSEAFERTHGMGPHAMAELVSAGWVLVNLHEYENDEKRQFADHEAHAEVLAPLLCLKSGCRIMYARRDRYFELLERAPARDTAEEAGRRLFTKLLAKESILTAQDRHELLGKTCEGVDDAIDKIAENWSYLVVFAELQDNPDLHKFLTTVRQGSRSVSPGSVVGILEALNTWKHLYASPQIKAFGGTLNLSAADAQQAFARLRKSQAAGDEPLPATRRSPFGPLTPDEIFGVGEQLFTLRTELERVTDALDDHQAASASRPSDETSDQFMDRLALAENRFADGERQALAALGYRDVPQLAHARLYQTVLVDSPRKGIAGVSRFGPFAIEGEPSHQPEIQGSHISIPDTGNVIRFPIERARTPLKS